MVRREETCWVMNAAASQARNTVFVGQIENDGELRRRVLEAERALVGAHGICVHTLHEPAALADLLDIDARHQPVDANNDVPNERRGIVLPVVVAVERCLVEGEEEGDGTRLTAVIRFLSAAQNRPRDTNRWGFTV
jgi:hypothetical protein